MTDNCGIDLRERHDWILRDVIRYLYSSNTLQIFQITVMSGYTIVSWQPKVIMLIKYLWLNASTSRWFGLELKCAMSKCKLPRYKVPSESMLRIVVLYESGTYIDLSDREWKWPAWPRRPGRWLWNMEGTRLLADPQLLVNLLGQWRLCPDCPQRQQLWHRYRPDFCSHVNSGTLLNYTRRLISNCFQASKTVG